MLKIAPTLDKCEMTLHSRQVRILIPPTIAENFGSSIIDRWFVGRENQRCHRPKMIFILDALRLINYQFDTKLRKWRNRLAIYNVD